MCSLLPSASTTPKGGYRTAKKRGSFESGDATLALKSCSHPSIVRD